MNTKKSKSEGFVGVHIGAGQHSEARTALYLDICADACQAAIQVLREGGSALDAAEKATIVLEDAGETNAGFGSNLTESGTLEMDAGLMDGSNLLFGAVGAITEIKNPIRVARKLVDEQARGLLPLGRVPPGFLVGEGARDWAIRHGIHTVTSEKLVSDKAVKLYKHYKKKLDAYKLSLEQNKRKKEEDEEALVCKKFRVAHKLTITEQVRSNDGASKMVDGSSLDLDENSQAMIANRGLLLRPQPNLASAGCPSLGGPPAPGPSSIQSTSQIPVSVSCTIPASPSTSFHQPLDGSLVTPIILAVPRDHHMQPLIPQHQQLINNQLSDSTTTTATATTLNPQTAQHLTLPSLATTKQLQYQAPATPPQLSTPNQISTAVNERIGAKISPVQQLPTTITINDNAQVPTASASLHQQIMSQVKISQQATSMKSKSANNQASVSQPKNLLSNKFTANAQQQQQPQHLIQSQQQPESANLRISAVSSSSSQNSSPPIPIPSQHNSTNNPSSAGAASSQLDGQLDPDAAAASVEEEGCSQIDLDGDELSTDDSKVQAAMAAVVAEERLECDDCVQDTVGVVVLDGDGNVAASVSSGGIALKQSGRVGQASCYGCGCWAQRQVKNTSSSVAVSTTGCGEHLVRTLLAKECGQGLANSNNPMDTLQTIMKEKFAESEFLEGINEKLGGAICMKFSKNSGLGSFLWTHTTSSMGIGFQSTADVSATVKMSRLPKPANVHGTTILVESVSFNTRPDSTFKTTNN